MDVSLKEFLERVLSEMDRRYEQRFEAQQLATSAALASTERALTAALSATEKSSTLAMEANRILALKAEEFADQKLATHNSIKPWVESLIVAQSERISGCEKRISRFENREEGMSLTSKIVISAVGFVATIVSLYFAFHR